MDARLPVGLLTSSRRHLQRMLELAAVLSSGQSVLKASLWGLGAPTTLGWGPGPALARPSGKG